ncbi:MAG: metallophosphoesterase [Deltaproteobacteria bacterium]|nr:metallophosphoesterase [Deltaproteobacteria bacterium]
MPLLPLTPRADHPVTFLTDVEGQWQRLHSFLAGNPHAALVDDRLVVTPGATLVFGGDAIDRGPHARRIVRLLLDAKLRQPDQIVLLAGNRDINKLRLATELAGEPPRRAPSEVKASPPPELLRWIFAHTMGAAQAFAFRQEELAAQGEPAGDDDVVHSFLDDVAPGGLLTRYLAACQLAWRAGRTLFVHGGVAREAMTVVPGQPPTTLASFHVDPWIERLNAFHAEQLDAFIARARRADGGREWAALIRYQSPHPATRKNPASVVYGGFGDVDNNPQLPEPAVVDALVRAGIARVVVGHTPNGDVASVVRTAAPRAPFEIVIADNSRSRVETACRVTVRDEAIELHGTVVLDEGGERTVDATLPLGDRGSPVGRRTVDGSLVKAPLDEGFHTFRYLPGYRFEQRVVAREALGPLAEACAPALDDDADKG